LATPSPNVFDNSHFSGDLRGIVQRSLAAAFGTQALKSIVQFVTTAVLARLLTPDDFGLFAIAMAFTGFASLLADMGTFTATLQRQNIDADIVSGLVFANLVLGAGSSLLILLLTPLIAKVYGEERLTVILLGLSSTTIMAAALGVQPRALLVRRMNWHAVGIAEIAAVALSSTVSIVLAATTNLGVWCLVVLQTVMTVVNTVLCWWFLKWRPTRQINWIDTKRALEFGSHITGFSIVSYVGRQADNLLIGGYWGPAALGLYTRAYGLFLLPITVIAGPLTAAVAPILCHFQNDAQKWRDALLRIAAGLTLVTVPVSVGLFLLAEDVILIVFGTQWSQAASILRVLAPAMLAEPLVHISTMALVSLGRSKEVAIAATVSIALTVAGFVLAVPYGSTAVAASYSIVTGLLVIPRLGHALRGTAISARDVLMAIGPQCLAGLVALAVVASLPSIGILPPSWIPLRLVSQTAIIGVLYILTIGVITAVGGGCHLRVLLRRVP
jgi:PST family polysaccharide transporter